MQPIFQQWLDFKTVLYNLWSRENKTTEHLISFFTLESYKIYDLSIWLKLTKKSWWGSLIFVLFKVILEASDSEYIRRWSLHEAGRF